MPQIEQYRKNWLDKIFEEQYGKYVFYLIIAVIFIVVVLVFFPKKKGEPAGKSFDNVLASKIYYFPSDATEFSDLSAATGEEDLDDGNYMLVIGSSNNYKGAANKTSPIDTMMKDLARASTLKLALRTSLTTNNGTQPYNAIEFDSSTFTTEQYGALDITPVNSYLANRMFFSAHVKEAVAKHTIYLSNSNEQVRRFAAISIGHLQTLSKLGDCSQDGCGACFFCGIPDCCVCAPPQCGCNSGCSDSNCCPPPPPGTNNCSAGTQILCNAMSALLETVAPLCQDSAQAVEEALVQDCAETVILLPVCGALAAVAGNFCAAVASSSVSAYINALMGCNC